MQNNHDITIEIEDINYAIDTEGKISGYSNTISIKDCISDLKNNISEDDFKNAKNIILIFHMNQNIELQILREIMEFIDKVANINADIVFGTNTKNNLDTSMIGYRILLTGI